MSDHLTAKCHQIDIFLDDEQRDWIKRECDRLNRDPVQNVIVWTLQDVLMAYMAVRLQEEMKNRPHPENQP